MQKYAPILKKCPLFAEISGANLESLLDCLGATIQSYDKGSYIFSVEDKPEHVGIVLTGAAHVIQEDFWGNRTILTHVDPGDLFAEAFSCAEVDALPVSVVTVEKSDIMLIDYRKIITTCSASCTFHAGLIKNMMRILAQKNIQLTQKMEVTAKRTTQEKLLSYLSQQALKVGENRVQIPFNRQELADYLCVDRSALSRELSKMRDDGILTYDKNSFELHRPE